MEQSVPLILLSWGDLRTKNTLHNKTLIPIGVPRIDMYVRLSCIVSGKQVCSSSSESLTEEYTPLLRMSNVRLFVQSRATWPRPLQRKHVISCVRRVVDPAPVVRVAPTGVVVLSRGVGVDGSGRDGAELDDEFLPAKVLEYILERRPCISRSALQANSNNWVMSAYSL
jgi:hypothetical protein